MRFWLAQNSHLTDQEKYLGIVESEVLLEAKRHPQGGMKL